MIGSFRRVGSQLTWKLALSHPRRKFGHPRWTEDCITRSHLTFLGITLGCIGASWAATECKDRDEEAQRPARLSYKYLICGGGVAAQEALNVFIDKNEAGDLLLLSPEWTHERHQFSKSGAHDSPSPEGIVSRVVQALTAMVSSSMPRPFAGQSPEIVIGRRIKTIDVAKRIAILDDATELSFERCLIAVGSSVPDVPIGKVVSRNAESLISGAQSTSDWNRIDSLIQEGFGTPPDPQHSRAHLTVVGGGWMSTAVGAELIDRGADVTFSHAEPAFLARYFPTYLAQEVLSRLLWASDGGVDSLSYAALRYIIARRPLEQSFRPYEAEVHVGTVFDSFSIVDFRTDHVIFAPTLSPAVPIEVPSATVQDGGFMVNSELAVASDVYAAGASISVGSGALDYPKVMRWSADHARATGKHAALNMMGARAPYAYHPSLTVHLDPLCLRIHVLGDVDGSCESFGYFLRGKGRGESTCGGQLELGVLFCVRPAPLSHRGAAQKLLITGVALWEGSNGTLIPEASVETAKQAGRTLLTRGAMARPELEEVMDNFASERLGISLFLESATPEKTFSVPDGMESDTKAHNEEDEEQKKGVLKPLVDLRKPSPRVIWRRHRSARRTRVRPDELLWVQDEWVGAVSPDTKENKTSQAYTDLLKRAAQS